MEIENTESIVKAAIEYLIAQAKEYDASLLLKARIALVVTDWDMGFSMRGEGDIEILDYSVRLDVEPRWLDMVRNGLTQERRTSIGDAINEALKSYHGAGVLVRSVYVDAFMALDEAYPLWREAYEAQLEGDNASLNQAAVGTNTQLFQWNGLRFRSRSEQAIAASLAKARVLFFPLRVVEFYDSNRCYKEPDKVVADFLRILSKS